MLIRISRIVAAVVACLLAAAGCVVLAVIAPGSLVGVVAVGAVVGAIVATHLPDADPLAPPTSRRAAGIAAAATTVFALLAMVGAGAVLGAAAGPLFVLLLPVAGVGLWRHRAGWRAYATALTRAATLPPAPATARPTMSPELPGATPQIVVPAVATVHTLCLAWHRSHWLLQSLPAGPARSELIITRERLLGELEQCDPAGFQHWLHRGVGASSDPRHYLTEHPVAPPPTGSPHLEDDDRPSM